MEAKNESTKHFVHKTGDKLFIEIEITGDPDKVIKSLFTSINKNTELFDGAKCNQIMFKGRGVDAIINNAKEKLIKDIKYNVDNMFEDYQ